LKISACVPVYDAPVEYLRATLESILGQEGDFELEVVVSDDASSSDYGELFSGPDGLPVIFHRNERNLGMVGNWNAAVGRSTGDVAMVVGQDDLLEPGMFATYARTFRSDPAVVLCACARRFIDGAGRLIEPRRAVNDRARIFQGQSEYRLDHREAVRLCLRNGNALGEPSAVMYRRSVFEALEGYDDSFRHAADLDFNLRASRHGAIAYFTEPFLRRRIHAANLTRVNRDSGAVLEDRERLFGRFAAADTFSAREMAGFRAYLLAASSRDMLSALTGGRLRVSREALRAAVGHLRPTPRVYARYGWEILSGRNRDRR